MFMPPGKVIIHRVHDRVDAFNARLLFLPAFKGLIMEVGATIIYDAFSAERATQGKFLSSVSKHSQQRATCLNAIIGIAMYVIPLGFLAMLAQSIWAHPPGPGSPEQLITKVRRRGK
jgi:hypothetical protein